MANENDEVIVPSLDENEEAEEQSEEVEEAEQAEAPKAEAEPAEKKAEPAEPPKQEPRQIFSMPVAKAQAEKKKAVEKARKEVEAEYEAKVERMKAEYEAKLRNSAPDTALESVAEKHGLDKTAAREFADAIRSSIKLPDTSKYDQIIKEREIESHKAQVSKDFDLSVAPLILRDNPNATPEFIREAKEKIEELAFTEGFNTYRLEDIYKVRRDEFVFKNGLSAETPGGRGPDMVVFKKLSDEDEIKLADSDPKSYERYLKWLEGSESKYLN